MDMSVEAFRMQNFMAFRDTDWIELRPITLLFGKNSSGKSVIGRALRLLKQSLESEVGSGPFVYATRQGVDVGDFRTIIHTDPDNQDWHKPLVFAFRCQLEGNILDEVLERTNQQYQREGLPTIPAAKAQDQVEIWLQYEWNEKREQAQLTELRVSYPTPSTEQYPPRTVFAAYFVVEEDSWWFDSDILHGHEKDKNPVWADTQIETTRGFLPVLNAPQNAAKSNAASWNDLQLVGALLRELREMIEQFLQQMDYLGPLRPTPERLFVFDTQRIRDWQNSGLRGYLAYLQGEIDEAVTEETNRWLQNVGLCHRSQPTCYHKYGDRALVASIEIRESEESGWRNLADVGSGLSQVLPVIVQSLVADNGITVWIEQPELHLHPSAQAALADMFIARAGHVKQLMRIRKEQGAPPPSPEEIQSLKVRFLLETHSEHILLRLRRRIAETFAGMEPGGVKNESIEVYPDDIAIYFVDRTKGESSINLIKFDFLGNVIEQPEHFAGFFADDTRDVFELTRAALRAKSRSKQK
ncbi:MAG: AAA family ATPase [Candidatus Diapherotrites archaeon]|nr:AAA family ATPase [Candidatus Diapherotrites archaeon]